MIKRSDGRLSCNSGNIIVHMFRKLLLISTVIIIFLSSVTPAEAFIIRPKIKKTLPGLNCGMANDPAKNACCYYDPLEIDPPPRWLTLVFWLLPVPINPLTPWNMGRDFYYSMRDSFADIAPCLVGTPFPVGISPKEDACVCQIPPDSLRVGLVLMCRENLSLDERNKSGTLSPSETARLDKEFDNCVKCAGQNGYYSAIGCIQFDLSDFITRWVFGFGVSLAGLGALFCIIIAAIRIQLSRGSAETVQSSREMMTSCILGLLLIVFSVFLLNFVGITILPGLFF